MSVSTRVRNAVAVSGAVAVSVAVAVTHAVAVAVSYRKSYTETTTATTKPKLLNRNTNRKAITTSKRKEITYKVLLVLRFRIAVEFAVGVAVKF